MATSTGIKINNEIKYFDMTIEIMDSMKSNEGRAELEKSICDYLQNGLFYNYVSDFNTDKHRELWSTIAKFLPDERLCTYIKASIEHRNEELVRAYLSMGRQYFMISKYSTRILDYLCDSKFDDEQKKALSDIIICRNIYQYAGIVNARLEEKVKSMQATIDELKAKSSASQEGATAATNETPAAVTDTTPASVTDTTPASVTDTTPASVTDTTPASSVDTDWQLMYYAELNKRVKMQEAVNASAPYQETLRNENVKLKKLNSELAKSVDSYRYAYIKMEGENASQTNEIAELKQQLAAANKSNAELIALSEEANRVRANLMTCVSSVTTEQPSDKK
jgi:hypothetical protein